MKKILIFAAAALILAACDSNEDNPDVSIEAAKISATIGETVLSRTVDNKWTKGDRIGISSTVGGVVGPYINVEYITDGDGKFKGDSLYFYKPMTLFAYYPYAGTKGTAPGNGGIIEANTRSDNQKPAKQPEIDFLWDSQTGFTAANTNVNFNFAHKMSKVTFKFLSSPEEYDVKTGLKLADGVDVRNLVSYKLNNLILEGTFNTNNGICAVNTAVSAESLSIQVEDVKHNEAVSPIIIFPQTLSDGSVILDLYTDELNSQENLQHYKCNLSFSNGEIKAGYHYIYTIQVTKIGLIVGKMAVVPWEEENRYMTATIDGEKVFQ